MNDIYTINFSIDIELANYHNFIKEDHLTEEYKHLQKKYYLLLEDFLDNILMITKFEKEIAESGYFYAEKIEIEKKTNIKKFKFNYFFIRNNLNIEVLSLEEMNILRNSTNYLQLKELISNTFIRVIKVNNLYGKKIINSKILYDGTGIDFLKYNDSLVLGFNYNLGDDVIPDEKWDEYIYKREKIKEKILDSIKNNAYDKLKCKIEFIDYLI